MKLQWLLAFSMTLLLTCSVGYAGMVYDEFISGNLEDVWEISKTSKAGYEIEDNYYVFKIELTENEFAMLLDDEEIQTGNRADANFPERSFHITPDGANDMHGPSTWTIDYIRLTGPTIPDLDFSAVEPAGKAATTWGNIKEAIRTSLSE